MQNSQLDKVDAVIVGAGAAGCFYAARLAAAGKSVVVLESGPPWQASDLISSQLWARRLKWRGPPVERTGTDPIAHGSATGSGLGGAALHHYATWPRFAAEVFEMQSLHGRGFDWPFRYGDLRPHYDRIQAEVGISGDAEAETWRPPGDPYPMPPLDTFRHGELLADGFRAVGLDVAPLPLAINSRPYRGRAACLYDGWCDAGCPIGALANPLVTYYPVAVENGARFITGAYVTQFGTSKEGTVERVHYVREDEQYSLRADVFILAASVIQSPRILLNSRNRSHPDGIGNNRGQVGRYLTGEGAVFCYGLFDEPTECHRGVNAGQYTYRELLVDKRREGVFGGFQWQIGPSVKPNDIFGVAVTRPDIFGPALEPFLRRATHNFAYMIGFCGGEPVADNRVTVSERKDAFGMPIASVEHRFGTDIIELRPYMIAQGNRVLEAAGASEVWNGPPAVGHLIGGTLMGDDPSTSVTDGYGRCHDAPNLVVAGAGLFPASGGASPTFTILAVADRSAQTLLADWPA